MLDFVLNKHTTSVANKANRMSWSAFYLFTFFHIDKKTREESAAESMKSSIVMVSRKGNKTSWHDKIKATLVGGFAIGNSINAFNQYKPIGSEQMTGN